MPSVNLKLIRGYRVWKAGEVVPIRNRQNKSPLLPGVAKLLVNRGWAEYADKPGAKPKPRKRASKRAADDSAGQDPSTD